MSAHLKIKRRFRGIKMFCPKCGKENPNDALFCLNCGERLEKVEVVDAEVVDDIPADKPQEEAKCWKMFAKAGRIVGIVAIATCWIPYCFTLSFSIHGIVASALGKKSVDKTADQEATTGLTLNILASVLSITSCIIWTIIFAIIAAASNR